MSIVVCVPLIVKARVQYFLLLPSPINVIIIVFIQAINDKNKRIENEKVKVVWSALIVHIGLKIWSPGYPA